MELLFCALGTKTLNKAAYFLKFISSSYYYNINA